MTALLTAEERRGIEERAWVRRRCPVCEGVIDLTRACAQCANRGHIYVVHEDTGALLAHIKELTRERDNYKHFMKLAAEQHTIDEARAESAETQAKELTKALATVLGDATHGQTETWAERCEIGRAALARHRSRTGREEEK